MENEREKRKKVNGGHLLSSRSSSRSSWWKQWCLPFCATWIYTWDSSGSFFFFEGTQSQEPVEWKKSSHQWLSLGYLREKHLTHHTQHQSSTRAERDLQQIFLQLERMHCATYERVESYFHSIVAPTRWMDKSTSVAAPFKLAADVAAWQGAHQEQRNE